MVTCLAVSKEGDASGNDDSARDFGVYDLLKFLLAAMINFAAKQSDNIADSPD